MQAVVIAVVTSLAAIVRSRMALQIEILALRHQLAVYHRAGRRPQLGPADRLLWVWLSRAWSGWRAALVIVQPRTVIAWQRKRLREYRTRLSRQAQRGRLPVGKEIRDLIRKMSAANPTWGAPRTAGELGKLGIAVAKSTVEKYRVRASTPPSPTWRTFLATHAKDLVAMSHRVRFRRSLEARALQSASAARAGSPSCFASRNRIPSCRSRPAASSRTGAGTCRRSPRRSGRSNSPA